MESTKNERSSASPCSRNIGAQEESFQTQKCAESIVSPISLILAGTKRTLKMPFKSPLLGRQSTDNQQGPASNVRSPNTPVCNTKTPYMRAETPLGAFSSQRRRGFKSPLIQRGNDSSSENSCGLSSMSSKKRKEMYEELRQLRQVELHRKKNNLQTLNRVTEEWRGAAHRALHELHNHLTSTAQPASGDSETLTCDVILRTLNIPADHVLCNCDDE